MIENKEFWKKIAEYILRNVFWWFISIVRVCKKQARFEGLTCIALCVVGLVAWFTFKGRVDILTFLIFYFSLGILFLQKNFWVNSSNERCEALEG
jgi:hypothetical protein